MTQTINLNEGTVRDILQRIYNLEHASPLNNAAIGRSGLLVYDGGVITIENGGLDVTGTATISGVLNASGTINMTGDFTATGSVNLNGPTDIAGDLDVTGLTTVTGTFNVNGPMKTTGTLSVEGVTTLKNDLNVTTGGKVKVGTSMTLDPSVSSGAVVFSNGAQVFTDAVSIQVFKGNSVCQIEDGEARLQTGGSGISATTDGVFLNSLPIAPAGSTSNVYIDGSGQLFKII